MKYFEFFFKELEKIGNVEVTKMCISSEIEEFEEFEETEVADRIKCRLGGYLDCIEDMKLLKKSKVYTLRIALRDEYAKMLSGKEW